MQDAHDLGLVIDAGVSIIALETYDEPRAIDLLMRVARERGTDLHQWSVTDGLKRAGFGLQVETPNEYADPLTVLDMLKKRAQPGIYALCDYHPWLGPDNPTQIRQLKDIALRNTSGSVTIVLISHRIELPKEVSRLSARFEVALPTREQLLKIVREEAKNWARNDTSRRVKTDNATLEQLVGGLRGLTHGEARRLVRGAIVDDGAITESDLPEINQAKFSLMDMEGVLTFDYSGERLSNVGGMDNLKAWLEKRRAALSGAVKGIDPPKGILLLGVQGGGKSLAAKAIAGAWSLPLLKLDMGALYNKFYGETERNLRESLGLAEKMSPCVLWLDEIEKGLGNGNGGEDSGTSGRVLGTLLTWMAERRAGVFLVATSNDISRLPPELVRKGRFDELFFVDLPEAEAREKIFSIHLKSRELNPEDFSLSELVVASVGFSGAEIEQAIVSALYSALAREEDVNTALILEELDSTSPLELPAGF
ncbi:MAG TPA: ATPase, partial [Porticoccaceae bacterium]|nr:ATPase [Porticoccaceae bacterium]